MVFGQPKRVQRRRTKGWRLPGGAVWVGRPSLWGNRYRIGAFSNFLGREVRTAGEAVELYRRVLWIDSRMRDEARKILRGRDLCCWCPLDRACHADVLLEVANA
jgi:hypothetical protein